MAELHKTTQRIKLQKTRRSILQPTAAGKNILDGEKVVPR